MNEADKKKYLKKYRKAKEKGIPFFPDAIFKDSVISLIIFLILVALAFFIGSPLEERANPADANYSPKPEWYFLFLFQLLKYFPGDLEVIGVVVVPTLAIVFLFLLPILDRHSKRHFSSRPVVIAITVLLGVGTIVLTILSIIEAPPPVEAVAGDKTAALYAGNCAGCHGQSITVPTGTDLHAIITQGQHEGMPAWSADLTGDEVDALAGFILSPAGSKLFADNCEACHEAAELVASDPIELRNALDLGIGYPAHSDLDIPDWSELLSSEERSALLNFLVAPDGQRLFATNCSACHGRSVGYVGGAEELRGIILEGGLHLEMPPWQERLESSSIDILARYVIDPASESNAVELYDRHCISCHFDRIPASNDFEEAKEIIATGGSHEEMPVWGEILTAEQLDALVTHTLEAAS